METLSKLWVDYTKSNVLADPENLQHDKDRIYLFGPITCDASARSVQAYIRGVGRERERASHQVE